MFLEVLYILIKANYLESYSSHAKRKIKAKNRIPNFSNQNLLKTKSPSVVTKNDFEIKR